MSDVNPCISQDIWIEIFKELPVKTLGKCRCVCKSWHSLIISPIFMTTHLNNYTRNDTNSLLLYREMSKIPEHEQYLLFLDSGRIPLQQCHASISPFRIHGLFKQCSHFVGSIHGLLSLSDDAYLGPISRVILWNPFLRKMLYLPKSSKAETRGFSGLTSVLGFAYDNNKNDHRVVKISFRRANPESNPLVEVFSVLDRIWRTIPADYLVDNSIHTVSSSHCFINGVIHWLTLSSFGKWILLFDVVEETFQKIELPEAIVKEGTGETGVFEYKTKLSVSICEYRMFDIFTLSNCRIWVKEEDESWCMILNVDLDNRHHIGPVEYLGRNGELFGFARLTDHKLVMYDIMTEQFTDLRLRQHYTTKFASFTESLVLLDQNTDVYTDDDLERSIQNRPLRSLADVNFEDDLSEYGSVSFCPGDENAESFSMATWGLLPSENINAILSGLTF